MNHDQDKLPIQEPTDTNSKRGKNKKNIQVIWTEKRVENLKILLRDLAKSWLSKAKFGV